MSHTPGPWRATQKDHGLVIDGPTPRQDDYAPRWCVCETISNEPEDESNASLIAAAPDLLAALKALFNTGLVREFDSPEEKAAHAAIAKAEGR